MADLWFRYSESPPRKHTHRLRDGDMRFRFDRLVGDNVGEVLVFSGRDANKSISLLLSPDLTAQLVHYITHRQQIDAERHEDWRNRWRANQAIREARREKRRGRRVQSQSGSDQT